MVLDLTIPPGSLPQLRPHSLDYQSGQVRSLSSFRLSFVELKIVTLILLKLDADGKQLFTFIQRRVSKLRLC